MYYDFYMFKQISVNSSNEFQNGRRLIRLWAGSGPQALARLG
jgi:hypothetical protein